MMGKKYLFIALTVVITIGVFFMIIKGVQPGTRVTEWDRIDQEQMLKEIEKENVLIVDLREPELYTKGHIPSSINIPFVEFEERYTELEKDKRIVFVCHTGPMGDASSQFLLKKGYENMANLTGGMAKWEGPTVNK